MSRPNRVLAYDALRVFAILAVVAIHALMPYRETADPRTFVRVLDDVLHLAVPLFVFVSGVFVWGRGLPDTPLGWRTFLSRRLAVIGIPYVAWSAVYLWLTYARAEGGLSAGRSVGLLLSGHTWYHLYFIPMLLAFYLLTPAFAGLLRKSPGALVVGSYAIWILAGPAITGAVRASLGQSAWSFATHVITHLPHMALGAWFARRGARLPRRGWLAAVLALAGFGVLAAASLGVTAAMPEAIRRVASGAGTAAAVLGLTLGAFAAEPHLERLRKPIVAGAALAFGTYLVHPIGLLAIERVVAALAGPSASNRLWYAPSVFTAAVGASLFVVALLSKTRMTRVLVGLTPSAPYRATPRRPGPDIAASGDGRDAA